MRLRRFRRTPSARTIAAITAEVRRELNDARQKWEFLFVSVSFDESAVNAVGYVYRGYESDWAEVCGAGYDTVELFEQLRAERGKGSRGPADGLLYRLYHPAQTGQVTYLWGAEAAEWAITKESAMRIRDKARPW